MVLATATKGTFGAENGMVDKSVCPDAGGQIVGLRGRKTALRLHAGGAALASPEQRARARAARAAAAVARAASPLRRDFLDAGLWESLARERGLRLPPWGTPPTPGGMRSWLRKCGVEVIDYLARAGERNLKTFGERNRGWPLRAWAGLVLEALVDGRLQAGGRQPN